MRSATHSRDCVATSRPTILGSSSFSRKRVRFENVGPRRPVIATVRRARRLQGEVRVPGDKSISHRALIRGSMGGGDSQLRGLSTGADVKSTASCMRALGVDITLAAVRGVGMRGLRAAASALECGNSGTTMRLLAGLLSAQPFASELRGDESLSTRPMDRVVTPLREMGADAQWPPLLIGGRLPLHGIEYRPAVPSAQVKSAVLVAGVVVGRRSLGGRTAPDPKPT